MDNGRCVGHSALVINQDLTGLPTAVQASARVQDNGEVMWSRAAAEYAIEALAAADRVVLGLDIRDYQPDGSFIEIAWSSFEPNGGDEVDQGRRAALEALRSRPLPGEWILVTWR